MHPQTAPFLRAKAHRNLASRDESNLSQAGGPRAGLSGVGTGPRTLLSSLCPGASAERAEGARPGRRITPAMRAPGREGVRGGAPLPDPPGRVSHHSAMRKGRPRGHRPEASEAVPEVRQEGCPVGAG